MRFSFVTSTAGSRRNRHKHRSLQLERMKDRSLMAGLTQLAMPPESPSAIVAPLQAATGKIASPISEVQQRGRSRN